MEYVICIVLTAFVTIVTYSALYLLTPPYYVSEEDIDLWEKERNE